MYPAILSFDLAQDKLLRIAAKNYQTINRPFRHAQLNCRTLLTIVLHDAVYDATAINSNTTACYMNSFL